MTTSTYEFNASVIEACATLFTYPTADAVPQVLAACSQMESLGGAPWGGARGLLKLIEERGSMGAEEHFMQVFDVNAARSLECGWHLYGEDYARGSFLVQMRELLRYVGVEEGTELPDYLPTLLRALARLPKGKAAIFSTSYLQPAIRKMHAGFAEHPSPYGLVMSDLLAALESHYGETPESGAAPARQSMPYDATPAQPSCSSNPFPCS